MITFFGASVTQQKNGYAVYLKKKIKNSVKIFGKGGMHLSNAGICYIDDVLKYSPEYCFIDWFSTDYIDTNENTIEYLNTLIYKFSHAKCRLVFLFFPRLDNLSRQIFYKFVKNFLAMSELYFIDLNDYYEYSSDLVKDSVHTTELGSQKYANIIYEQFIKDKAEIKIPSSIPYTQLVNIKHIVVQKKFREYILLQGNSRIVTFEMNIGRYSGLVVINNTQYNIWDIWCHYDRPSCKLDNIAVNGDLRIHILQDSFDTSKCRRDGINFKKIGKKLIINRIFYTRDSLSLQEGK